jgi:hypothetical protein
MFCPKCGKEVDDTAKYCPYCGALLHPDEKEHIKPEVVTAAGSSEAGAEVKPDVSPSGEQRSAHPILDLRLAQHCLRRRLGRGGWLDSWHHWLMQSQDLNGKNDEYRRHRHLGCPRLDPLHGALGKVGEKK